MTSSTDYTTAPYLAVAPNYYGRGFTIEEAKANLKATGGKVTQYAVYRMPKGATNAAVDDFGMIVWKWSEEHLERSHPGEDRQPEIVASRGLKK
jgi:hypothetical protein